MSTSLSIPTVKILYIGSDTAPLQLHINHISSSDEERFQKQQQQSRSEEGSEIGFGPDRISEERRAWRKVHVGGRRLLLRRAQSGPDGTP